MKQSELISYLDEYLAIGAMEDKSNNGLQVEGSATVERVALAVDASLAAFEAAARAGAQMLIVHHGLFWGAPIMITGLHHRRLATLFEAGLSLYAAHLPLDFHPTVGNNATLARWFGLEEVTTFGNYNGFVAGVSGRLAPALPLDAFKSRVEDVLGEPVIKVWPFGPDRVETVAISSGGGSRLIEQAAAVGMDVYLTGEMSHNYYHVARELGLNVVYGGHYATETAGLQALGEHLANRFDLETVFVDLPTGA